MRQASQSNPMTQWSNPHSVQKNLKFVTLAYEAETTGTINNTREGLGIKTYLIAVGDEQSATPLRTNNSTTAGFVDSCMKPKHSKP